MEKRIVIYMACLVIVTFATVAVSGETQEDILIADFESEHYGDWKAEGDAFGTGPAKGKIDKQGHILGFTGKGLVNTFLNGDKSTGTLTSSEFTVERDFINMRIGGGNHPGKVGVKVIVDGQVAGQVTGHNYEVLLPASINVKEHKGKKAVVQVFDHHGGGWGHINVDDIAQSNTGYPSRKHPWKQYKFEYETDPAFHEGPIIRWKMNLSAEKPDITEKATGILYVPTHLRDVDMIRGIMVKGDHQFEEFALLNGLALCDPETAKPYGGPHKIFLEKGAKLCGHPELAHAGVIVHGLSNGGRFAAHYAHFWPERTIAVVLDHSFCNPPVVKQREYHRYNLPVTLGIPYFFNASKKDMYQNHDRRVLNSNWCKKAFRKYSQACTAVISREDVQHFVHGTRLLEIVWLQEVLDLRVPEIDPGGKPYKLKLINPRKTGGYFYATLDKFEGRTIHNNVGVGPVGCMKKPCWWVPGPKSAAMIIEWVKENGGKVLMDKSSEIKDPGGK